MPGPLPEPFDIRSYPRDAQGHYLVPWTEPIGYPTLGELIDAQKLLLDARSAAR